MFVSGKLPTYYSCTPTMSPNLTFTPLGKGEGWDQTIKWPLILTLDYKPAWPELSREI